MLQEQSKLVVDRAKRINISSGEDVLLDDDAVQEKIWNDHVMEQDAPYSMEALG